MNQPASSYSKTSSNATYCGSIYRFVSTGKERDEETGYGYFGARYMDHELMTMWLSVDPMSDKYPDISPYAYCAWNPVNVVDPNGCDTIFSFTTKNKDGSPNYGNQIILAFVRSFGDPVGIVSVAMHGSSYKSSVYMAQSESITQSVNVDEFMAQEYIPSKSENQLSNNCTPLFILYSCHTGGNVNTFGQELSEKTGGVVIAPENSLWVTSSECYIQNDCCWNGTVWTKPPQKIQPASLSPLSSGNWNVYYNGELKTQFNGTIRPIDWINQMGGAQMVIKNYDPNYEF